MKIFLIGIFVLCSVFGFSSEIGTISGLNGYNYLKKKKFTGEIVVTTQKVKGYSSPVFTLKYYYEDELLTSTIFREDECYFELHDLRYVITKYEEFEKRVRMYILSNDNEAPETAALILKSEDLGLGFFGFSSVNQDKINMSLGISILVKDSGGYPSTKTIIYFLNIEHVKELKDYINEYEKGNFERKKDMY